MSVCLVFVHVGASHFAGRYRVVLVGGAAVVNVSSIDTIARNWSITIVIIVLIANVAVLGSV